MTTAPATLPHRWHVAITTYLTAMLAGGLRPKTIRLRRWQLQSLAEALPDPWTVTTGDLREYLAKPTWAPETRKSVRTSIRSFYAWAEEEGHVQVDPAAKLKAIRIPNGVPKPAPESIVRDALEAAEPRVRLMIALAAFAGLRAGEIATVNQADVVGDVLRVTGKGGATREVPLVPGLQLALLELADEGGWVFPTRWGDGPMTSGTVTKLVSAALPDGWTAHKLRHRFASAAYAGCRDLLAVGRLLGHARPETTQRYVRMPDEALRDAVGHVGDLDMAAVVESLGGLPEWMRWDPARDEPTPAERAYEGCDEGCCRTISAPCPSWCQDGHGHPYDHRSQPLTRMHTRGYGHDVVVEAMYEAAAYDGPEVVVEAAVSSCSKSGTAYAASEARGVASAFLAAASDLERLGLADLPDAG